MGGVGAKAVTANTSVPITGVVPDEGFSKTPDPVEKFLANSQKTAEEIVRGAVDGSPPSGEGHANKFYRIREPGLEDVGIRISRFFQNLDFTGGYKPDNNPLKGMEDVGYRIGHIGEAELVHIVKNGRRF